MKLKLNTTATMTIFGGFAVSCFYLLTTPKMEIYGSDTSIYYELARSLLYEHKYWFNFEPHTVYPPGQPVFLAGLMYFFGESFSTLIKCITVTGLIGVIGTYAFIKHQYDNLTALIVTLLTLSSSFFYLWLTAGLTSDVPYFTMTVWSLYCFEIANQSKTTGKAWIAFTIASLLALYSIVLRSLGITFIAGIFLWSVAPLFLLNDSLSKTKAFHRLKRWVWVVMLCALVFFMWGIWSKNHRRPQPDYDYMSSYTKQLLKKDVHDVESPQLTIWQVPGRAVDMMAVRSSNAVKIIFSLQWFDKKWTNPLLMLTALLILLGWMRALTKNGSLLEWYILMYIGLLTLWPFDENGRFLFAVQPFLYLYLIQGVKLVYTSIIIRQLQRYYPLIALFMIGMAIYLLVEIIPAHKISRWDLLSLMIWLMGATVISAACVINRKKLPGITASKSILAFKMKPKIIAAMAIAVLIILGSYRITLYAHDNLNRTPAFISVKQETATAVKWIIDNTSHEDVIVVDEFAIVHRLTRRKTLRFPLTTDPSQIWTTIINNNAKYIVVPNEIEYEYCRPCTSKRFSLLHNHRPSDFTLVHEDNYGKIFQVTNLSSHQMTTNE